MGPNFTNGEWDRARSRIQHSDDRAPRPRSIEVTKITTRQWLTSGRQHHSLHRTFSGASRCGAKGSKPSGRIDRDESHQTRTSLHGPSTRRGPHFPKSQEGRSQFPLPATWLPRPAPRQPHTIASATGSQSPCGRPSPRPSFTALALSPNRSTQTLPANWPCNRAHWKQPYAVPQQAVRQAVAPRRELLDDASLKPCTDTTA